MGVDKNAGEEEIKRAYWQIPADLLVVPANLAKFGGRDASCFGELCPEQMLTAGDGARTPGHTSVYDIALEELGATLAAYREQLGAAEREPAVHRVPGFKAKRCVIIIEPEWMIEEAYGKRGSWLEEVRQTIEIIRTNSVVTRVEVIHADVSRAVLASMGFPGFNAGK